MVGADDRAHHNLVYRVRFLMLLLYSAVITGCMRFGQWVAGWVTLWSRYGWARVRHEHLQLVRIKPELVVSNGDVLNGLGQSYFVLGLVIWISLAWGLLTLIFRELLPPHVQAIMREKGSPLQNSSVLAVLIVLPLALLIAAFLEMSAAMMLAGSVSFGALIWLRTIRFQVDPFDKLASRE